MEERWPSPSSQGGPQWPKGSLGVSVLPERPPELPHLKGPVAASREGSHLWLPLWGHRAGKACGGRAGAVWPQASHSTSFQRQGAMGAGNRLGIGAVIATIMQAPPPCTCSDAQTLSGASATLSLTGLRATYTYPTVACYLRTRDMEKAVCNKGHTSGLQCGDHPRAPASPGPARDRAAQAGSSSCWDETDRAASWLNSHETQCRFL